MKHILDMLKEKNFFLEKFYFINETELNNFRNGNFLNLESFYSEREGILNLIGKIDLILEESELLSDDAVNLSSNDKKSILGYLDKKNNLVNEILSQDLEILSFIEEEKSTIIKELSEVKVKKKGVQHYQSTEV